MSNLNSTIERLSASGFNNEKKAISRLFVKKKELNNRNFKNFDFSQTRFFGCKFTRVIFDRLLDVEFAECEFFDCTFSNSLEYSLDLLDADADFKSVKFYECEFTKTDFKNAKFKGIVFGKCTFHSKTKFNGSEATGPVIIRQCSPTKNMMDIANVNIIRKHGGWLFFQDGTLTPKPIINWLHIRNVAKIPLLQISLIAITAVSFSSVFLAIFNSYFQIIGNECKSVLEFVRSNIPVSSQLTCGNEFISKIYQNWHQHLAIFSIFSLVLGLTHTIHNIACDSRILEYSPSEWQNKGRPLSQYNMLCCNNIEFLYIVFILYILCGIYAIFIICFRLSQIWLI